MNHIKSCSCRACKSSARKRKVRKNTIRKFRHNWKKDARKKFPEDVEIEYISTGFLG